MDDLLVCWLGTVEYRATNALQETLRERRLAGEIGDVLLLLEHPPVYTLGRRSGDDDLPLGEEHYRRLGIDVVRTRRGGRLTYHAPGQLVGYPIMRIETPVDHLRRAEQALVDALAQEGVDARSRIDDGIEHMGVWVGERKIASVGVHVSRGVSIHGFAVNVDCDLSPWGWVVPCGLPSVRMTSIAAERGGAVDAACFRKRVAHAVCRAYGRRQRIVAPARLGIDVEALRGSTAAVA